MSVLFVLVLSKKEMLRPMEGHTKEVSFKAIMSCASRLIFERAYSMLL
jgi:hypothetical protein